VIKEAFAESGFAAPLCWYRTVTDGSTNEDDKGSHLAVSWTSTYSRHPAIPADRYEVTQPVFFAGAKQDYVCLSKMGIMACTQLCKDLTIREFDTGHWVQLEAPTELNTELLAWIETVKSKV